MKTILFSKHLLNNTHFISLKNNAPDLPLFWSPPLSTHLCNKKDSGLCGQQVCRIKSIKHTTELFNFGEINVLIMTS